MADANILTALRCIAERRFYLGSGGQEPFMATGEPRGTGVYVNSDRPACISKLSYTAGHEPMTDFLRHRELLACDLRTSTPVRAIASKIGSKLSPSSLPQGP